MKNRLAVVAVAVCLLALPAAARAADYHHVHLAAPNVGEAVQWYITHMGCTAMTRPDACQIGTTQLIFANRKPDAGSQGSGVDHIGFSFPDLDAKMRAFEAAGVKIVTPMRDAPGLFKLGFIEDPWGTRIEVVEDRETLGFHHIHLRSADPDAALKWYQNVFGGQTDSLKGRLNGLRYGTVWLLVTGWTRGSMSRRNAGALDRPSGLRVSRPRRGGRGDEEEGRCLSDGAAPVHERRRAEHEDLVRGRSRRRTNRGRAAQGIAATGWRPTPSHLRATSLRQRRARSGASRSPVRRARTDTDRRGPCCD